MSQEKPNENNKSLENTWTKEDFINSFLQNLEQQESEGNKSVVKMIAEKVPAEFVSAVTEALENIKRELKAQFMVKAEVLASEFYDEISELSRSSTEKKDIEVALLKSESDKKIEALEAELSSGEDKIVIGEGDFEKKRNYIRTLSESVTERQDKVRDEALIELKRMLDKTVEEHGEKAMKLGANTKSQIEALASEFWDAYIAKAEVLAEEFKS